MMTQTKQTLTDRVTDEDSILLFRESDADQNMVDLSSIDEMLEQAKHRKYEMYRSNPDLANKETYGRMLNKTGSFIGNALRYLVFWPKFIKECVWENYDDFSKDDREGLSFILTVGGIASSIGASLHGWSGYSSGNMGIVPTLALNIGIVGGVASLAYDGLKSWFNLEREQTIEGYHVNPKKESKKETKKKSRKVK